jgi:hypothetical protein
VAKQSEMDFYMPSGVVVRQEARSLSLWKPRKPYKLQKPGSSRTAKLKYLIHNQNASKKYHDAIDAGHEREETVKLAVKQVEAELDAKQNVVEDATQASDSEESEAEGSPDCEATEEKRDSVNTSQTDKYRRRHSARGSITAATIPRKRNSEELSEDGKDENEKSEVYEVGARGCLRIFL